MKAANLQPATCNPASVCWTWFPLDPINRHQLTPVAPNQETKKKVALASYSPCLRLSSATRVVSLSRSLSTMVSGLGVSGYDPTTLLPVKGYRIRCIITIVEGKMGSGRPLTGICARQGNQGT